MSASYPGAPKVFTSRSAGQTIASAHINDLQDEVNAIESGLLGGSAPVSASNASFANLTVSGGSTLAGAVVVGSLTSTRVNSTGACSFAMNSTVYLSVTAQQFVNSATQPRCVAYHNAAQTVNAAATTILTLNSEDVDTASMHDPVTNNDRVTIPTGGDGYYVVTAYSQMQASGGAAEMALQIKKNGATVLRESRFTVAANGAFAGAQVVWQGALVAADYVDLLGVAVTNNVNFGSATRSISTTLEVVKLW